MQGQRGILSACACVHARGESASITECKSPTFIDAMVLEEATATAVAAVSTIRGIEGPVQVQHLVSGQNLAPTVCVG
jgi:hypothetical protein